MGRNTGKKAAAGGGILAFIGELIEAIADIFGSIFDD